MGRPVVYHPEYGHTPEEWAALTRQQRSNFVNGDKRRAYNTAWRSRNKPARTAYLRATAIKRNFGITVEDYDKMFIAQSGRCAICHCESTKALAVDHCHTTGKVRGLLCTSCNTGLGLFKDNLELLEKAKLYLVT
jgi:hypothetical protein